jgi:hypothetical protein
MDQQVSGTAGNKDYTVLYINGLMTIVGNTAHHVLITKSSSCGRSRLNVRSASAEKEGNECGEMLSFRPAKGSRIVISSIMTFHRTIFPDRDISAVQHENKQIIWPLSILRSSP